MSEVVRGMNQLQRSLNRLADLEVRLITKPIAEQVLDSTRQRFRDARAPNGQPWTPLADSTVAARRKGRRRRGSTPQILLDTARLRNSISYQVKGLTIEWGTNVRYARIHQLGGRAGRGRKVNIPARPFLGFSPADRAFIQKTLRDWVTDQTR